MTAQETQDIMYVIGRIFAKLETSGVFRPDDEHRQYELVSRDPAHHLPPLIRRLIESGKGDSITALMAQLPPEPFPAQVPEVAQGDFGLGYYHQKGEDRPNRGNDGRPRVYDEPRAVVYLRLPARLVAALDQAVGEGGNRTRYVERLLRKALNLPVPESPQEPTQE